MEITSVELQEKINSGKKVIVEFWAEWCGPCKMMKPLFERVASQNTSNVEMYTMNVDLNKEIGASLGIRSIPTIKVFQNSNIIDTRVGMMNEGQINGILTELING
jgi:thioredoxin 1